MKNKISTLYIGYTPRQLQEYVVSHQNYQSVKGTNWHLDHIFPIVAFQDYGITDIRIINALDNLRPVSQKENNQKHARYNKKTFESWLISKGVVTS